MKRKQWWILGGGLVVVLAGGLSVAGMRDQGIGVQAAPVGRENLQSKVSANGKVQAVTKADISANVMGQVTRLAVKEGDRVTRGQFLMEIDPRNARAISDAMQASLQAAKSDLTSATATTIQVKADFERARANRQAGIISTSEFEKARTALETAQAAQESYTRRMEQAKATVAQSHVGLGNSTITAPMDGTVTPAASSLARPPCPAFRTRRARS